MLAGLIFDLGSTLIYHTAGHTWSAVYPRMRANLWAHLQALGYTLDQVEFTTRLGTKVAEFERQRQTDWVEYTTGWLLQSTLAELGAPPLPAAALAQATRAYYTWSESLWQPMPQVHETLRHLQAAGYRLAIVSNAPDAENVQRLIDNAQLRPYFDPIIISATVGIRKPNPKIFELVLAQWQVPAAACVMVGDTLGADILGAQMSGLADVWLSSHAQHPANLAHRGNIVPTHEIAALADLPALVENLAKR